MKKYLSYKPTNVEWIGEIPSQWSCVPIRWSCNVFAGGTPSKDKDEYWNSPDIPWLNSGEVNKEVITSSESYISHAGFSNSSAKWIKDKSVVMALAGQGKTKASVAALEIPATCNQSMAALEPNEEIMFYKFVYYYLKARYSQIRGLVGNDSRDGLNLEIVKTIILPMPTVFEQQTIAAYLDRKTALIDETIRKKQQLIELLQEERTALINKAVTRGLDDNVKLKPSGVEWLGEIPAHWKVKKLKYVTKSVQTGSTPPSDSLDYYEDGDFNWFTPGDFDSPLLLTNSRRKITEKAITDDVVRIFPRHSILMVGIGATLGKIGIAAERCSSNQQINAIVFDDSISPFFGAYFLRSFSPVIVGLANASTLAILNQTQTRDLWIVVPPTKEQSFIVDFLQTKSDKTSKAISKIENEIALLKEYRTALINEVVTGKVCVLDQ